MTEPSVTPPCLSWCALGGFENISSSSTLSVGQDIDNISLNMKGFEI